MTVKEQALRDFEKRREKNKSKEQKNNALLPAGSPMYFYCKYCSGLSDVLPENYWISSPKHVCKECETILANGWFN